MTKQFEMMVRATRAYVDMVIRTRPIPQRLYEDICNEAQKENKDKDDTEEPQKERRAPQSEAIGNIRTN